MRLMVSIFMLGITLVSCGKDKGNTVNPPTNLTVNAVVATDNSGNVNFTASAANATSYEYGFGNGIFQTVSNGILTYRYPASGTYSVTVVAKNSAGNITKTINVTVAVQMGLVWSDEFDTPGAPDPSKWGYDLGAGGWGNNELQYYTNRLVNASVSNGTLKIVATREAFSGSAFTSARLLSKGKFSFKYGKLEFRAKLPSGGGTWPALWMLGDNISTAGWPACGEIDVMEHVGNQPNKIYGTLHYPGRSGGSADGSTTMITNAMTAFHDYAVEWNSSTIKISVDGTVYHTVNNTNSLPFNQNFFLIMNIAMGGNLGGSVDPAFSTGTMEVEYVRVYQ